MIVSGGAAADTKQLNILSIRKQHSKIIIRIAKANKCIRYPYDFIIEQK